MTSRAVGKGRREFRVGRRHAPTGHVRPARDLTAARVRVAEESTRDTPSAPLLRGVGPVGLLWSCIVSLLNKNSSVVSKVWNFASELIFFSTQKRFSDRKDFSRGWVWCLWSFWDGWLNFYFQVPLVSERVLLASCEIFRREVSNFQNYKIDSRSSGDLKKREHLRVSKDSVWINKRHYRLLRTTSLIKWKLFPQWLIFFIFIFFKIGPIIGKFLLRLTQLKEKPLRLLKCFRGMKKGVGSE